MHSGDTCRAVREELGRISISEAFRGSDRLRRLVEYLVLETIEGRAGQVKEYSVGLSVFGKPDSFDPKVDSTVRSEVSKLRAKLRLYYETEGRGNPVVLSIPRGGYSVEWEHREVKLGAVDAPATRRWPRRAVVGAGISLVLVAALGWYKLYPRISSGALQGTTLRRLTTDTLSSHPWISREGALVVFASDRAGNGDLDLWLQPVASKDAIRLTSDPVDDYQPAISPDGALIAYRSERDGGGVYLIPALGGTPRLLVAGGSRPRFSPDGKYVAYSVSNIRFFLSVPGSGTAYVIPVEGGTPTPIAPEFASSHFPIFSPDGRSILFVGAMAQTTPGGRSFDWWLLPVRDGVPGGKPVRTGIVGLIDAAGLRGADARLPALPDAWHGNAIIFGARSDEASNLWRQRLSPSGVAEGRPERVTLGASTELEPAVSEAGRVVFTTASPNGEIVSVRLDAETGVSTGPVEVLAQSPAADGWPSVSSDGRLVLFYSSRRERQGLHLYDARDNSVTGLLLQSTVLPWSEIQRDGRSYLYFLNSGSERAAWERSMDGKTTRLLCKACASPSLTQDGRTVVFAEVKEPVRIRRRDLTLGTETVYLRPRDGSIYQPMLSPDERWIAFYGRTTPNRTRIYLAPWSKRAVVAESEWIAVTEGESHDTSPVWSPQGRVLYFASDRDGFNCIWGRKMQNGAAPLVGEPFAVRHFHKAAERASNLGVSHRGFGVASNRLVLKAELRAGNLWLLE